MRRADLKQLHSKTKEELQALARSTRDKLSQALIELAQNKLKDTSKIKHLRDDIAKILTVMKEKEDKNVKNFNG